MPLPNQKFDLSNISWQDRNDLAQINLLPMSKFVCLARHCNERERFMLSTTERTS